MIYEVKSYSDDEGRRITEKIPLTKSSNSGIQLDSLTVILPIYTGIIVMQTQMGNMPIPFEFPMGYNVEKCFQDFDRLAQEKIEEIKDANKIIPATGMPKVR